MVIANLGGEDLPVLLPLEVPWLTWVTLPRVPRFATAGSHNKLLLVDPNWRALAAEGGWPPGSTSRLPAGPIYGMVRAGQESTPGPLNHASDRAYGRSRSDASDFARPESDKIDPASDADAFLGIIADWSPPEPPERLVDYSSHLLLWNSIRQVLEQDPLLLAAPRPMPAIGWSSAVRLLVYRPTHWIATCSSMG